MKKVYLVRHGQTLFNVQKKIQGFCDSPLTELGIKQAKIARGYLEKEKITIDEAHVSTSERAIDTLKLITDVDFKMHKNLREWNFGTYEGEGEHLNPPLPYADFFVQFKGESQDELSARINSAITEIVTKSESETILIVSHGGAIANFYRIWEDFSDVKRTNKIDNCSILKYEYKDNLFVLEEVINHDFSAIQ